MPGDGRPVRRTDRGHGGDGAGADHRRRGGEPAGAEWEPTDAARQWITGIVAAARPVVICAHRQNLSWLLAEACAAMGAPVPSGLPLRKGAFWALQVSGGRLASAEHHLASAGPDQAGQDQAGPADEAPADGESAG